MRHPRANPARVLQGTQAAEITAVLEAREKGSQGRALRLAAIGYSTPISLARWGRAAGTTSQLRPQSLAVRRQVWSVAGTLALLSGVGAGGEQLATPSWPREVTPLSGERPCRQTQRS